MNQQTKSILMRSISRIEDFRNSKINLEKLVNDLAGSIAALEEKLPDDFYQEWLEHIIPLDTVVGLGKKAEEYDEIIQKELDGIEKVIRDYLVSHSR